MYAKECIKARQNGQIGWIFILRSEKYTGLKKYITKLIHPRICIECKISWLAPSSSFGSFIPEMLFIISLGTKARAGGVFSQREFIVSQVLAAVTCTFTISFSSNVFAESLDASASLSVIEGWSKISKETISQPCQPVRLDSQWNLSKLQNIFVQIEKLQNWNWQNRKWNWS